MIGDTDTGKTSLAARLAGALATAGFRVGVVDADLGQSEVGPPTMIGLGRVEGPIARLSAATLVELAFVGATSPAGHLAATVAATAKMVTRARWTGFDRVLVDTSGLVTGDLGRALKRAKIARIDPDLLVCLQRGDECEPLLAAYDRAGRPAVLRLPAAGGRRRTPEERRQHRERALRAYLADARPVDLRLGPVALRTVEGAEAVEGALAGVENAAGETLGLGRVIRVDRSASAVTVETPVAERAIAAVVVGWETFPS